MNVARTEHARRNSTSPHTLSADRPLTKFERVAWVALNLANNALPRATMDRRIVERQFRLPPAKLDELWLSIRPDASPSRALCDLFWLTLPWPQILRVLGSVHALEMGCGSGTYGHMLSRLLGNQLTRYLGVDIAPNPAWPAASDDRLEFRVGRAGDVEQHLLNANLVFTQSALEHIEEDLHFLRQVARRAESRQPLLQFHLIPSASCITTFPWHGIREYTPRTISQVTRLFGAGTDAYLYALGGTACNRVHRKFIVWPRLRSAGDQRRLRAGSYASALRAAVLSDFAGSCRNPSFYALVLVSNFACNPFREVSNECAV